MTDNKKVPRTLNECLKPSSTVDNLHLWADRLEEWGTKLFYILIVVGIISIIVDVVSLIDYQEELIFPTLVSSVISWALYAFLEYLAYHALALLIRALAVITHNTSITANVALFESGKTNPVSEDAVTSQSNQYAQPMSKKEWVCTCGRTNASYISTCNCGKNKRDIQ